MPVEDDAPRLSEIGRRISDVDRTLVDFRNEVRAAFHEMVRKETYLAERDALRERVTAIEQRAKSLQNLVYAGLITLIVTMIASWFIGRGGT